MKYTSIFLTFFFFLGSSLIFAQNSDVSFAPIIGGTQGSASKITSRADGKLVVTGNFQVIAGIRRNSIAVFNTDGTIDNSFDIGDLTTTVPQATASIGQVSSQPDSKLIVIGSFTHINGIPQKSPVRLNTDGSIDSTFNVGQGANSSISIIKALSNGKVLVGGFFNSFNNQSTPPLIRLNSDGSIDQSFSAIINGFQIYNLIVQPDGKIIAVGDIYSIQNGQFQGIVRLNENGSIDNTFNPGSGPNNYIRQILLQPDGKILIGGDFTTYNGTSRISFARINSNGSLDSSFTANVTLNSIITEAVFDIQTNGQILIGGSFDQVNGIAIKRLARLQTDGSVDQSFVPIIDQNDVSAGTVSSVYVLPDQNTLITGNFYSVNQIIKFGAAKISFNGTTDVSFNLDSRNVGSVNETIVQQDGKILLGGSFSQVNGILKYGLARINLDGSVDSTFNIGQGLLDTTPATQGSTGYYLNAIALQNDGKILLGGYFRTYNNTINASYARINPDGTLDSSFSNAGNFANVIINDITVQNDNKIIFACDSGNFYKGIFRLNFDGTRDTSFNIGTGANDTVTSVAIQPDGKVLIAGFFTTFNGVSRNRVARLNADGSLDTGFNTSVGANSFIRSIVLQANGKVLIGGGFTSINGTNRNRIARLNSDGSIDTSFDPGTGADSTVNKLTVQADGKILIGGNFNNFAGTARKKLARVLENGSVDSNFGSNLDFSSPEASNGASIYTLLQTNSGLFVGGYFSKLNGRKLASFSKLFSTKQSPFDFDSDTRADFSVFRPSTNSWYLSQTTGGFAAIAFGLSSDKLAPADYDGDGKTDIAVYRDGYWIIRRSSDNQTITTGFGLPDDIPVPADFDGDGKADISVYRPSNGVWYRLNSSNGAFVANGWGSAEDKPAIGDFDGDGRADLAVYRPSNGVWYIVNSSSGQFTITGFGAAEDLIVPADYDGDGKTDIAVYRPSNNVWYRLNSKDGSFAAVGWGTSNDKPVPADYDGDGKTDIAVYRDGTWFIVRSSDGQIAFGYFGDSTDIPIPNVYVK